jgi:hypothetical protein
MGLVNSSHKSENTNVKRVLIECGFIDTEGALKGLAKEIFGTVGFAPALMESFALQQDAKGAVDKSISAVKLSTNANIRLMQKVLCFWKIKFPDEPIPRAVKHEMQRLACLVLSYLFF